MHSICNSDKAWNDSEVVSPNFRAVDLPHTALYVLKVQKLDVSIRPLFANPVTHTLAINTQMIHCSSIIYMQLTWQISFHFHHASMMLVLLLHIRLPSYIKHTYTTLRIPNKLYSIRNLREPSSGLQYSPCKLTSTQLLSSNVSLTTDWGAVIFRYIDSDRCGNLAKPKRLRVKYVLNISGAKKMEEQLGFYRKLPKVVT